MENVNDELTARLLELNQYCYDHHVDFNVEISDKKKNSIRKGKNNNINVVLNDIKDKKFLDKVVTFLEQLLD